MKSDIEKQRHSSRTTIGQTLRDVTIKKVLWGRNKKPKFGNDANLEINVIPYVFYIQALHMPRFNNSWGVYPPKIQKFAHFSLVSLSPRTRSRPGAERIRQGEGRLSRPPRTCCIRSSPADVKQNKQTLKPCRRQAKQTLESMPPQNSKH